MVVLFFQVSWFHFPRILIHVFCIRGNIISSHCSCPIGGDGRCKHVGALLLSMRELPPVKLPPVPSRSPSSGTQLRTSDPQRMTHQSPTKVHDAQQVCTSLSFSLSLSILLALGTVGIHTNDHTSPFLSRKAAGMRIVHVSLSYIVHFIAFTFVCRLAIYRTQSPHSRR